MGDYEARSHSVETVLHDYEYKIPDYQREYAWKEDLVGNLWDDLLYASHPKNKKRKYLLGPLVELRRGNKSEVVDGQQRLVTLSLLFRAMRDALNHLNGDNKFGEKGETIKTELDEVKGHVKFIDATDNKTFENINKHLDLGTNKEPRNIRKRSSAKKITGTQQRLIVNYNQLFNLSLDLYKTHNLDDPNKYKVGLKEILQIIKDIKWHVMFVMITISLRDDIYTIFQSLNSKNIPLKQADLIKSHLIAESGKSERTNISNQWTSMIKSMPSQTSDKILYESMLSRDGREIPEGRLYEIISHKYKKDKINEYLEEIKEDIRIINKLNKPKEISDIKLKYALFCLLKINAKYFRRIVIAAMRKWGHENKKTIELIKFLIKFFFMYRVVCRNDISTLRTASRKAATQIESGCEIVQIFQTVLMDDKNQELIDQDDFIKKFENALSGFTRKIATYILAELEHHYESKEIQYPIDELQLEHIFPQNPKTADWPNKNNNNRHTNRLGNLTLVTGEWNPSLSNSSFVEKMLGDGTKNSICYNNSNLKLNELLKKYNQCKKWSSAEMTERETQFLETVPKIWNMEPYLRQIKQLS